MDTHIRYRKRPNFIAREIAGETLLVPVTGKVADLQRVIALNGVGAFIWEQLEQPRDLEGIVTALVDAFEVDSETARKDAVEFIDQMKSAAVIDSLA